MQLLKKTKKGQISFDTLMPAALGIGVTIILVIVFAILITNLQSDQEVTTTISIVNESNSTGVLFGTNFTLANNAGNTRDYSLITSSLTAFNASASCDSGANPCEQIAIGNFTINSNGTIGLVFGTTFNNTPMNFTYDYNTDQLPVAANVSVKGNEFFQNLTNQMPLLGTVIILALVLAVVIGIFIVRKTGRGGI